MTEDKRQRIILVFENMIVSLDATVRHPDVEDSHRQIGRAYLDASQEWLSHLRGDRGHEIVLDVPEPHLNELGRRSSDLTGLVRQRDWDEVLRQSHTVLNQLPGKPWFKPINVPLPPRRT